MPSAIHVRRFVDALERGDVPAVTEQLTASEFVLLHVGDDEDNEDLGALTADFQGDPYLVSFSSQEHAGQFVGQHADVFDGDDEVSGFLVDGETLLDYLADGYGLLINPESSSGVRVEADMIADVLDELGLADP